MRQNQRSLWDRHVLYKKGYVQIHNFDMWRIIHKDGGESPLLLIWTIIHITVNVIHILQSILKHSMYTKIIFYI
jgi:hypothetical protein